MTPARARQLLGVLPGAPATQVEAAFRHRAWGAHPDRGGDPREFAELTNARRTLLEDPAARRVLDDRGARRVSGHPGKRVTVTVEPDLAMLRRRVETGLRRWLGRRLGIHLR